MTHPVSELQLKQLRVEWVDYDVVRPNKYNPNRMTWHDRRLLRQSILEDGWTQPIVTLEDGVIVDGEQRWTVAGMPVPLDDVQEIIDKMETRKRENHPISESILERLYDAKKVLDKIAAEGKSPTLSDLTGGKVPITRIDLGDDAHKRISTIRHNRARGVHQIDAMAEITQDLIQLGLDLDDLETRLGMDDEEIQRFLHSAEGMLETLSERTGDIEYSTSWEPRPVVELVVEGNEDLVAFAVMQSEQLDQQTIEYHQKLAEREQVIEALVEQQIGGEDRITQDEKDRIRREVERNIDLPPKPELPSLKKVVLFLSPEEHKFVLDILGERMAVGLVNLCRQAAEAGWSAV